MGDGNGAKEVAVDVHSLANGGHNQMPVTVAVMELDQNFVDSMRKELEDEPKIIKSSWVSESCSIQRAPKCFIKDNEKSYEPQLISIGPFHYKKRKNEFYRMEEHKRKYLRSFLARNPNCSLEILLSTVKGLEEEGRKCYSEEFDKIDSNSFARMMVLDGCFIVELFCRISNDEKYADDPIIKLGWLRKQLSIDLLMLENQIPFFILKNLYQLLKHRNPICEEISIFEEMALDFFKFLLRTDPPRKPNSKPSDAKVFHSKIKHLLHLLHIYLLPPGEIEKARAITHPSTTIKMIPCASQLQSVGIRFKEKEEDDTLNFLDIKFRSGVISRGVIEIPPLTLSDVTGALFLNLVAFEQCYRYCTSHISAYIVFLDCLIGSVDDVTVLFNSGINNSYGCNQSLVTLVNKIGSVLILDEDDFYLSPIFKEINDYYCNITRIQLRASFVRSFLKTPWAVISLFTIIFFQILGLVKSFFSP